MKKSTTIKLTDKLVARLQQYYRDTGISASELIRGLLNQHFYGDPFPLEERGKGDEEVAHDEAYH